MRLMQTVLMMTVAVAALVVAGCGGGGGDAIAPTSGVTLTGTVLTSGMVTASAVDKQAGEAPVPDCPVTVERLRDRQRLDEGQTDGEGRFRFEGLPAGEQLTVRAHLGNGEELQARVQLRSGNCQAEVSEATTLAAACQQALGDAGTLSAEEAAVVATAAGACERYQRQNGFAYEGSNGQRPDFSNAGEVNLAAMAALTEATSEALQLARQTRAAGDCQAAADLMAAMLQARKHMSFMWSEQVRHRVAQALADGLGISDEDLAGAAGEALGVPVAVQTMAQVRERVRAMLHEGTGGEMDAVEALAGLCIGDGDQLRLRTREQVRTCVEALLTAEQE